MFPQEQYELVYRTIRFLFERYLQSEEVRKSEHTCTHSRTHKYPSKGHKI